MELICHKKRATLGVSVKLRNDYADYDYLEKLSKEDLNWLKGFHREFVNADFDHKHKKIYKNQFDKRIIYGLNNTRNRDLYNIKKWTDELFLCEKPQELPEFTEQQVRKFLNENEILFF